MNVANQNQPSSSLKKPSVATGLLDKLYQQSAHTKVSDVDDKQNVLDGAGAAFAPSSSSSSTDHTTSSLNKDGSLDNPQNNQKPLKSLKHTKSSPKWILAFGLVMVLAVGVGLVVFSDLLKKKEAPTAPVSEPAAAPEGACTIFYDIPFLQCADMGCQTDADCGGGLVCVVAESGEHGGNGFCSEPEYVEMCQENPSYENCCSPAIASISGQAYCLEPAQDDGELPTRYPISSGYVLLRQMHPANFDTTSIPLNQQGWWYGELSPLFDIFTASIVLDEDGTLSNGLPYSIMTGPELSEETIELSECTNLNSDSLFNDVRYIDCVIASRENHTHFDFIYSNCLLECGQSGCTTDNQCQDGLVCVTYEAEDGELTGYCSETEYQDTCVVEPNYDNCCSEPPPTNTPTPTATPDPSITPSATPTGTPGPSPTNTPGPSPTNTPGPSPTNTPGPSPTNTPGPQPTPPYATPLPTVSGEPPKYIVDTQPECNDECDTNADCRNISHICYNGRCRLDVNPEDEFCRTPAGETYVERIYQPPVAGPSDWLNYLKIGVGAIGAGLLLLLLL